MHHSASNLTITVCHISMNASTIKGYMWKWAITLEKLWLLYREEKIPDGFAWKITWKSRFKPNLRVRLTEKPKPKYSIRILTKCFSSFFGFAWSPPLHTGYWTLALLILCKPSTTELYSQPFLLWDWVSLSCLGWPWTCSWPRTCSFCLSFCKRS